MSGDKFAEQLDKYMALSEHPHTKFIKEATGHLSDIAKHKASGNKKGVISSHKRLDKLIHGFVGKEGMTPDEKKEGME